MDISRDQKQTRQPCNICASLFKNLFWSVRKASTPTQQLKTTQVFMNDPSSLNMLTFRNAKAWLWLRLSPSCPLTPLLRIAWRCWVSPRRCNASVWGLANDTSPWLETWERSRSTANKSAAMRWLKLTRLMFNRTIYNGTISLWQILKLMHVQGPLEFKAFCWIAT